MPSDSEIIRRIIEQLPAAKRAIAVVIVRRLAGATRYRVHTDDRLFPIEFAGAFEAVLQIHHASSAAPFSKDKFEWGLVQACKACGMQAAIGPRGLAGHDVEVNGERWSLKTQADANIRLDRLHISKFMELGKGRWETEGDLAALRDRMLLHLEGYDRILSLRHFSREQSGSPEHHMYELVEIPKALLAEASGGQIEMRHESRQIPKPGYCRVPGRFELYFDGGTERKLQIKNLLKEHCVVHAQWWLNDEGHGSTRE